MNNYILVDGKPAIEPDLLKWARWMEEANQDRIIRKTQLGDVEVSTVFLGTDHNFISHGPPILYETMIFGGEFGGYQDRYGTAEEALEGHEAAVKMARRGDKKTRN